MSAHNAFTIACRWAICRVGCVRIYGKRKPEYAQASQTSSHLLTRLVLVLILGCTTLISAARLMGTPQPSMVAVLFTKPDGTPCPMPCLLGVRHNASIDEAFALLHKHPLTSSLRPEEMHYRAFRYSGPGITVMFNAPFGQRTPLVLLTVSLPPDRDDTVTRVTATLGDVLRTLGEPEAVYPRTEYVWLVYFGGHLIVMARPDTKRQDHLELGTPIRNVTLRAQPFSPAGRSSRWRGFRSIRRYEIDSSALP